MKILKIQTMLFIFILVLIFQINQVIAADIYVNVNNNACRDTYSRQEAMNSSKPFCTISAAFQKAESADNILVADGVYRNASGHILSDKSFENQVTIRATGTNAIITAAHPGFDRSNTKWTKEGTSGNVWTTNAIDVATQDLTCHLKDNTYPLFPYRDSNQFYDGSMPEGTLWNDASNILKIRLSGSKNPNNISIECHNAETLQINNVDNVKIQGLIFRGGIKLLRLQGNNDLIITGNKFYGGLSDSGAIDIRNGNRYRLSYNLISRTQPAWWWELTKYGINTETSAIWGKDGGQNLEIERNSITGYFNGIVLYTESTGKFQDAKIRFNTLTDIYDDAIEIEMYANGYNISHNNITNYYVAVSLAPADSSQKRSVIQYNKLTNPRTIEFRRNEDSNGLDLKTSGVTPINFDLTHLSSTPPVVNSTPNSNQPPVLTNGGPTGTLRIGTTSINLTVRTDEPATCKYSNANGTTYSAMTGMFNTNRTTTHTKTISGLSASRTYYFHVRCQDINGTTNTRDYSIVFSIPSSNSTSNHNQSNSSQQTNQTNTTPRDTTAPTRTNGRPSNTLSAGTTSAVISLNTNEASTCKYSTLSGTSYSSMPSTFSTTGSTTHSRTITGLENGRTYTFNIRCRDASGNMNTNDYQIRFTTENTPVIEETPRSSGGGGGGGSSSNTKTSTQIDEEVSEEETSNTPTICGDDSCSENEDCSSCQTDCGFCPITEVEENSLNSNSGSDEIQEDSVVKAIQPTLSIGDRDLNSDNIENANTPQKATIQEVTNTAKQVQPASEQSRGLTSWFLVTLTTIAVIILCLYNTEISVFTGKKNRVRIVVKNKNFAMLHNKIKQNILSTNTSAVLTADQLYSAYPEYAQRLIEYIHANRIVGVSDRKTKIILVNEGWPEDIVKAVLKSIPKENKKVSLKK